MSATIDDYLEYDRAAAAGVIVGSASLDEAAIQAAVSSNWRGFLGANENLHPDDVQASGDLKQPTMWSRWSIAYDAPPELDFEGGTPVRQGSVIVAVNYQAGSLESKADQVLQLVNSAFQARPGDDIYYHPGQVVQSQPSVGFAQRTMVINFLGV